MAEVQSVGNNGNSGTASATLSATPTQGNLLYAAVSTSQVTTIATPSGWTLIDTKLDQGNLSQAHFFKEAGASESTTVSFTLGESSPWAVAFHEEDSYDGNGLDQSAASQGSGTAPDSGNITPQSGDVILLGSIGAWANSVDFSSPTNSFAFVIEDEVNPRANISSFRQETTGGSAISCGCTINPSSNWVARIASFGKSGGGGGTNFGWRRRRG